MRDNSYLLGNQFAKGVGPNKTSFPKGNIPWNKGLRGIHLSPNSEFKPGRESEKKVAIGTIRVRLCKGKKLRKHIKVGDPNKWIVYAMYVWQTKYGKLLRGDVIHHINGDPLDDRMANLIALPRTDHPIFHSRWGLKSFSKKQLSFYRRRYSKVRTAQVGMGI